ncbi:hypothetical protein [Bradyrhizobium ivorense]|uniref:hypothetical protein n=1 Tax=Bradyrhizobium ivorense TaxID=2511166 RepID=UPI0010B0C03E|nr:hypothetical protein [Bradyrhizobium ivorense]VIO73863.1 hypothetical protein CI41S_39720 [Bradyrhizobium ivorense]
MIAALYVHTGGAYYGLDGVDPWDEARDARRYAGPWPVVAHPPCQRWGNFYAGSPLAISRGERKKLGDDGGCFEAALAAVREFGGVIEHPQDSRAWAYFGLNEPPRTGGWVNADFYGGWTCRVEQGFYGHFARKPTWLVTYKVALPSLRWGFGKRRLDPAIVERMGLKRAIRLGEIGAVGGGGNDEERIATPAPFRDLLISMARSVRMREAA